MVSGWSTPALQPQREGPSNVFVQAADGTGTAERIMPDANFQSPSSWLRDGNTISYVQGHPQTGPDIWAMRLSDRTRWPLVVLPARQYGGRISPDGRWLAYTDNTSGTTEAFITTYPQPGSRWQAYVPFEPPRRLMAVAGRDGSLHTLASEPNRYLFPRVSPDGRRIAVNIGGEGTGIDVWLFDVERETLTRVTKNRNSFQPLWDSTGTTLTFGSEEEDNWSLRSQVVDSSNASTVVLADREGMNPHSWLPDGRTLLFSSWKGTAPAQLPAFLVTVGGSARALNLPPSGAGRYVQGLSPGGRWLGYVSNESGAWEAYVTAFPGPGTTKQVSRGGGRGIRWAKTGTELYYLRPPDVQPTEIMKVSIRPDGTVSQPMLVLKGGIARECENCPGFSFCDTFPDGSLVVLKDERLPAPKRLEVIVNWSAQRTFDRD